MKKPTKIALWTGTAVTIICMAVWIASVGWYLSHASTSLLLGDVASGRSSARFIPVRITYIYLMGTRSGKRRLSTSTEPLVSLAISASLTIDDAVKSPERLIGIWKILLAAGQPIDKGLPYGEPNGITALQTAAMTGNVKLVRFLLAQGANPARTLQTYGKSDSGVQWTILGLTLCSSRAHPGRDYGPVTSALEYAFERQGVNPDIGAAKKLAQRCHSA